MTAINLTLATIHSLRTFHYDFSDQAITDEDLQTILQAAVRAANASARQTYSIVVVEDRAMIKELGGAGSHLLIFCVDFTRLVDLAAHLGYEVSFDGMVPFITGAFDTALAAQTAVIAAKSLGIDSLFTNSIHRMPLARVYELLQLPPRYCFPLMALALGYAKNEPAFQKGRLSGHGIIHHDRYHRLSAPELDTLIEQYDDETLHLGLSQDWRNDETMRHYLDWFFTHWHRPVNEEKQREVMAVLKSEGFM